MRRLVLLFCFLLSAPVFAKPYIVSQVSTFNYGDWQPIPEHEMRAAAVDTALSEISNGGLFKLVSRAQQYSESPDGELMLNISLVGEASIVKMTISLHLDATPSYVATTSLDIHNMDRQQIFKAFEYVGTESAKRLNAKIRLQEKRGPAPGQSEPQSAYLPVLPAVSMPFSPQTMPQTAVSELTMQRFSQAQDYKRQGQFNKARALYELLVESALEGEQEWVSMANDELRYGLPMFEAQMLSLSTGIELHMIVKNQQQVTYLYRQILAGNQGDPQRIMIINARLDDLAVSRVALARVMKHQSLANMSLLKMMLMERYSMQGEWPGKSSVEGVLERDLPHITISDYQLVSGGSLRIVLEDNRYSNQIIVTGDNGQVMVR